MTDDELTERLAKRCHHHLNAAEGEYDGDLMRRAMARIREMRAALEFYADERMYQLATFVEPPTSAVKADRGKRAREVLDGYPD